MPARSDLPTCVHCATISLKQESLAAYRNPRLGRDVGAPWEQNQARPPSKQGGLFVICNLDYQGKWTMGLQVGQLITFDDGTDAYAVFGDSKGQRRVSSGLWREM